MAQQFPWTANQIYKDGLQTQATNNALDKNLRSPLSGLAEAEDADDQSAQYDAIQDNQVKLDRATADLDALETRVKASEEALEIRRALDGLKSKSGAQQIVSEIKQVIEAQSPALQMLLKDVVNDEGNVPQSLRDREVSDLKHRIATAETAAQRAGGDLKNFKDSTSGQIKELNSANKELAD